MNSSFFIPLPPDPVIADEKIALSELFPAEKQRKKPVRH